MMWNTLVFYYVLVCCLWHSNAGESPRTEMILESRVISDILLNNKSYVKEARPATRVDEAINVTVVPVFLRIEDINPRTNMITAGILMVQTWTDVRLKWNKTDYGGVGRVKLPSQKVWLPDIVPYNMGVTGHLEPINEEMVSVTNTGRVNWGPLMTVTSSCEVDVTNFPFDSQSCSIFFGSWMHSMKELNMVFIVPGSKEEDIPVTMENSWKHVGHPQWDIVNGKITAKLFSVSYGPEKFGVLSVTVNAKRKDSFYKYLAIGPGALLGFLVPIMFLLPARSKEKITFGMLLVLGLILLISVLSDAIPMNHSRTPRVGMFYLITLILVTFSIILSILVSNISHRGARRRAVPGWIHKACLSRNGLRRLMCIDQYTPVDNLFRETMRELEDYSQPDVQGEQEQSAATDMETSRKIESVMQDTNKYLRYICGKLSAEDSYKNVNSHWEELARIMDRVLFVIFTILYALTALGLLT